MNAVNITNTGQGVRCAHIHVGTAGSRTCASRFCRVSHPTRWRAQPGPLELMLQLLALFRLLVGVSKWA